MRHVKEWRRMIITNDAVALARRIKYFMEEHIEFNIEFAKGIYDETIVIINYLRPEEGIDVFKMWNMDKEKEAV